jgi:hypothetical protein
MKFFQIEKSSERKVIGREYPQIQTSGGTVNAKAPDSYYNVYSNVFPDFIPNLNYLVLHEDAILTDVLSAAVISSGFIVNEKVKNVLSQHKLPPHKFYPATIEHRGVFYQNYSWFFYVCDVLDYINYQQTEFYIGDFFGKKIESCENITSSNLLRSLMEVLPFGRAVNSSLVYFNEQLSEQLDLFKVSFGNYGTYVSEALYDALSTNSISGIELLTAKKVASAI